MKIQAWPIKIDHITIQDASYQSRRTGSQVNTKVYIFHVGIAMFDFNRPLTITAFQGQNDAIIDRYKNLATETVNGETIISAKTIAAALEPGKTAVEKYIDDNDGSEYKSYGEWLLTMGTKNAFSPKPMSKAGVFATMPISDGIQRWRLIGADGKPQIRQKTGMPIIQQTVDVCEIVSWVPNEEGTFRWWSSYGSPEDALRHVVTDQISRGRWKLVGEVPVATVPPEPEEAPENTGE